MTETDLIKTVDKYSLRVRSCPLFVGLSENELYNSLDILYSWAQEYDRGEYLHQPYSEVKRFGLVLSGTVLVCTDDIDGNRMIMAAVSAGNTFGESLCWLGVTDSPVYIYAGEQSVVLTMDPSVLRGGKEKDEEVLTSELRRRFTSMIAARTLKMNSRIQVLSKLRLRDKLNAYFSELAMENSSLTFNLPLNREDTAAYIGTDRSALSREMSRMKSEGLIDYFRNTVRIIKG